MALYCGGLNECCRPTAHDISDMPTHHIAIFCFVTILHHRHECRLDIGVVRQRQEGLVLLAECFTLFYRSTSQYRSKLQRDAEDGGTSADQSATSTL